MEFRDIVDDHMELAELAQSDGEPFLLRSLARQVPFQPLEDHVMALARADSLASLETRSWLDRLVAFLFGLRPGGRTLADPRLEALRRAVVVIRHRHHLPDAQAAELKTHGFTLDQIHAIEARAVSA